MGNYKDLTGNKYNMLTVLRRLPNSGNNAVWECRCDCGNITKVTSGNLKNGSVKSCGCLRHINTSATHNKTNTRLYRIWAAMKQRCYNSNYHAYKNYGGRGIAICDDWVNSFDNFYNWAIDNGYREDLSIERINVDDNYCPNNCTWITLAQQAQNRRSCYMFYYNNKEQNLSQWCNELSLDYKLIHNRIFKLKWSFERAISEPVHTEKRNKGG